MYGWVYILCILMHVGICVYIFMYVGVCVYILRYEGVRLCMEATHVTINVNDSKVR